MRNEDIEIKAIENGFLVTLNWYPLKDDGVTLYKSKRFAFKTWEEVANWVKETPLTQPPVQD